MKQSLVLVFLLVSSACSAHTATYGANASGGAPPPLPAGVAPPMFDHYCAGIEPGRNPEDALRRLLDEASAAGWEMVAVAGDALFCFKRPRPPAGPPGAEGI